MVKVTGGGRGMKAIAAHFRYISKNGQLDIEAEFEPLAGTKRTFAVPGLPDQDRLVRSVLAEMSSENADLLERAMPGV